MDGDGKFGDRSHLPDEERWFYPADELGDGLWHCHRCASLVRERDDHNDWHDRVLPELIKRLTQ